MKIKSATSKLLIYSVHFIWIGFMVISFFGACKKEIDNQELSSATIKYYLGSDNNKVNNVIKTKDGGFIYCGNSGTNSTNTEAFLLKVNADGKQEWYKTFGERDYDEFFNVIQTSDGGFLAVGQSNSNVTGSTSNNFYTRDFTVKLNSSGVVQWIKSSHPSTNGYSKLYAAVESPDGSFFVTGNCSDTTADILLIRYNQSGQLMFDSAYPNLNLYAPFMVSENYHEYGRTINIANDGTIMIGGVMSRGGIPNQSQEHITFMMHTELDGTVITFYPIKSYEKADFYIKSFDNPHRRFGTVKLINYPDGYLVGTFYEFILDKSISIQLMRTDLMGVVQWEKRYYGLGYTFLYDIELSPDGTLLLMGCTSKEPMDVEYRERFRNMKSILIKVDKDGNKIWEQIAGGDQNVNVARCVQPNSHGGWNVAGYTCFNESSFDQMFMMQVDNYGNLITK